MNSNRIRMSYSGGSPRSYICFLWMQSIRPRPRRVVVFGMCFRVENRHVLAEANDKNATQRTRL